MAPNKLYSNVILRAVRIIALITFFLLIFTTCKNIYEYSNQAYRQDLHISTAEVISALIANLITIVFAAILFFYPQKFFFIGIGIILQSLGVATFYPFSYMSLLMLGIATGTFLVRTNHIPSKKRFFIILAIIYLYEYFIALFHDDINIIDFTTEKFGSMFAFLICLFFIYQLAKQKGVREGSKDKVLNLAQFKGLDRSDMILL